MSRSGKPALGFAVLLTIGVVGGALFLRQPDRPNPPPEADDEPIGQADVRTDRLATGKFPSRRDARDNKTPTARPRDAGVHNFPDEAPTVLPQLSGYIVDKFDNWTTIPAGYRADGIHLIDGVLTLTGEAGSTAPRSGMLASPPISLRSPALAGPADKSAALEEGAGVDLELSLSEDGVQWSPWVVMEKYRKPDGHRVVAPVQASLANADLESLDSISSATVSGPSLRYRLHLSASGVAAPSVADVRIWKRELQ